MRLCGVLDWLRGFVVDCWLVFNYGFGLRCGLFVLAD